MPTDELEQELRRAFTGAKTGIPDTGQAVQRLRQVDYRLGPGPPGDQHDGVQQHP